MSIRVRARYSLLAACAALFAVLCLVAPVAAFALVDSEDAGNDGSLVAVPVGPGGQLEAQAYEDTKPYYAYLYSDGELVVSSFQSVDSERTLVASFSDPANTYYMSKADVPWNAYRSQITKVTFNSYRSHASIAFWFQDCTNLETLNTGHLSTGNDVDMHNAFKGCTRLRYANLADLDANRSISMASMFEGCTSLTYAQMPQGIHSYSATLVDMSRMFYGCSSLKTMTWGDFSAPNAKTIDYLFYGCSSLESLDLSGLSVANDCSTRGAFQGCTTLESLDVSKLDRSNMKTSGSGTYSIHGTSYTYYYYGDSSMLSGCSKLSSLTIGSKFKIGNSVGTTFAVPSTAPYRGKWLCPDETERTATQLTSYLKGSPAAGEYAWAMSASTSDDMVGWTYDGGELTSTPNVDWHNYLSDGTGRNRARVTYSYLHMTPAGELERVECVDGELVVERVASDYRHYTARKVIDSDTYWPSEEAPDESVKWGGFFSGATHNFIVTGQTNHNEDDSVITYRVTKYTKNWNYVGKAEVRGADSYGVFDNGSCRMEELDGMLYVRTNRVMYSAGEDHHTGSIMFRIYEERMKVVNAWYSTDGGLEHCPVSHSWNQFAKVLNGTMYYLDHGDSSPYRAAVVHRHGGSFANLVTWGGGSGNYRTGGMVGGFEVSETAGTLISVGTKVKYDSNARQNVAQPWIAVVNNPAALASGSGLTDNTENANVTQRFFEEDGSIPNAECPFLVKVNDGKFLAMWSVQTSSGISNAQAAIRYQFIDAYGNALTELKTGQALLSDCQPIVRGNKVVWYAGGRFKENYYGSQTVATQPAFYELDVNTAEITKKVVPLVAAVPSLTSGVEGDGATYEYSTTYTGSELTPTMAAKLLGGALTEGTDFTVSYANNVNAGTATAIATGKGDYFGTLPIDFTVKPLAMIASNVTVLIGGGPFVYTGEPIEPTVTVLYRNQPLVRDVDYTLWFAQNTYPGRASVTVSGKGNFKNYVNQTFQIESQKPTPGPTPGGDDPGGDDPGGDNPGGGDSGGGGGQGDSGGGDSPAVDGKKMHRLYNPNSYEHFYTGDDAEFANLVSLGWQDEQYGWTAPTSGDPVYRLYNPNNGGDHHYTLDAAERDMLIAAGWSYEGTGWFSDPNKAVTVYREYNPNEPIRNHNYTANLDEHNFLVSLGWRDELIAWYGM